jgi:pimeloyl-ACP methyl ester carboxylesterase
MIELDSVDVPAPVTPERRARTEALILLEPARLAFNGWRLVARRAPVSRTVMVLPGRGANDVATAPLRAYLRSLGHEVHGWGLGAHRGEVLHNVTLLKRRLAALNESRDRPVALVGWSLGGLFAREIAKLAPESVARVITLGTPFSGDPRANNAWRAYQLITGHSVDAPPPGCLGGEGDLAAKPPVPTVALWSPRDGVVAPRSACGWPGERDRAVALRCSHLGFAGSAEAIRAVLAELD